MSRSSRFIPILSSRADASKTLQNLGGRPTWLTALLTAERAKESEIFLELSEKL